MFVFGPYMEIAYMDGHRLYGCRLYGRRLYRRMLLIWTSFIWTVAYMDGRLYVIFGVISGNSVNNKNNNYLRQGFPLRIYDKILITFTRNFRVLEALFFYVKFTTVGIPLRSISA